VERRTDVVAIFPNAAALHRLAACGLIAAHDEWQVSDAATSPKPPPRRIVTVLTPA